MMNNFTLRSRAIILVGLMLLLSGCVTNQAVVNITPGADLSEIKHIYVEKFAPDERGIDKVIVRQLEHMGYQATSGDVKPIDFDVVITYEDKWMWDITMYMLQLTVIIRDKESSFPLATARTKHGSLSRLPPEKMVEETLNNLLGKN